MFSDCFSVGLINGAVCKFLCCHGFLLGAGGGDYCLTRASAIIEFIIIQEVLSSVLIVFRADWRLQVPLRAGEHTSVRLAKV